MTKRPTYIEAVADDQHAVNGTAVVGSYQSSPATDRPFKLRGVSQTAKTTRLIAVALTRDEAQKLVHDWVSFGLFGRHGRVETKP